MGTVDYGPAHLRPSSILSATVRARGYRQRLSLRRVRPGIRRGFRVRVPAGVAARRPRLVLLTRDLAAFDGVSARNGSIRSTRERAYSGRSSVKAAFSGWGSNSFARVWNGVRWRRGSDVWYGAAFYIPRLSDFCWWNPIRWDNYATHGGRGDVGGLQVERGKLFLISSRYGGDERKLIGPMAIPQRRWSWVEVHQRLHGEDGRALSEVFIDGRLVGRSTAANSAGRMINDLRVGNVAMDVSCSRAGAVYFDRVWVSRRRLGPLR